MHYARISPAGRKAIAVLLLSLTSISCTGALSTCGGPGPEPIARTEVIRRELPPLPAWARAVSTVRPAAGTDWREIAKAHRNGELINGARLTCLADWYGEVRVALANGREPRPAPRACAGGGR